MRLPQKPPGFKKLFTELAKGGRIAKIFDATKDFDAKKGYKHWDTLRHVTPPAGLTKEELWLGVKFHRLSEFREIPLRDGDGHPFSFCLPDEVLRGMHEADLGAGGTISMPDPITNPHSRHQYVIRSLIQEAITSSQLEGAVTTREVAKEMIRSGRSPRDKSEQMILNNFVTMQRIQEWKDKPLDPDLLFEIHRCVTDKTMERPDAGGRLRRPNEQVVVQDSITGDVVFVPPPAQTLEQRVLSMCKFANETTDRRFIHPVVRAILLHFWLAYDHPFVDGNGRTARALFYWAMLRNKYWLFEFISISEILVAAPSQYATSYLHAETDDNDLTYFLIYQIEVIVRAIGKLHDYIERKTSELKLTESMLKVQHDLNYRQQAVIAHALRNTGFSYSVESHRRSHGIAYDTARKDLLNLHNRGLLEMTKSGKAFFFGVPKDIAERVRQGGMR